ncbi:hypothetical protein GCM10010492_63570 [Saccharothrix mutabilis subsp. mutabilis]|uniref:Uncharacterized protein n=1 Tax=Saccharothrix mutabilis subsp. mutabilis TaxID=66855 RepID=A0ABN0UL08_9PSEU
MVRKVFTSAGRHRFPTGDPILLEDGGNLLDHLSPAPVVARVGRSWRHARDIYRTRTRAAT